jgi:hypothetical protein
METPATHEQDKPSKRRKSPWAAAELRRHEGPRLRPTDICIRRGVSRTTEWRVRRLAGFPEPDAFGTFDARAVDQFWNSLQPGDLAAMRQRKPRGGAS